MSARKWSSLSDFIKARQEKEKEAAARKSGTTPPSPSSRVTSASSALVDAEADGDDVAVTKAEEVALAGNSDSHTCRLDELVFFTLAVLAMASPRQANAVAGIHVSSVRERMHVNSGSGDAWAACKGKLWGADVGANGCE